MPLRETRDNHKLWKIRRFCWWLALFLVVSSLLNHLPAGRAFQHHPQQQQQYRHNTKTSANANANANANTPRNTNANSPLVSMTPLPTATTTTTSLSATTASESSSESSPSSNVSNDNWRLIPKDADDYESHLVDRPEWSDVQYRESLALYEQLTTCDDSYVSPGIRSALETLEHAYRLYGPGSVICSFNGGKDAVVILHLVRAVHAHYYHKLAASATTATATATATKPIRPRAVYFNNHDEFSEVTSFLEDSVSKYDLDMVAFEHGVGFAAGLDILVKHNFVGGKSSSTTPSTTSSTTSSPMPVPMAFVLGTRESDPNAAGQDRFSPSSDWMPPFMRVNPVLYWNYGLVWHFLRLFKLPYCSLYDKGYTSLGTTKDTHPCPALAVHPTGEVNNGSSSNTNDPNNDNDGKGSPLPKFWPAYMLVDWDQERAGRVKKAKPGPKAKKTTTTTNNNNNTDAQPTTKTANSSSSSSSTVASSDATATSQTSATTNSDASASDANANAATQAAGGAVEPTPTPPTGDDAVDDAAASDAVDDTYGAGKAKTVGMLVVGDEILKGMTTDTNTQTAARALRKECLTLSRVVVVSDDVGEIAAEIRRMRGSVDVVITSGGVGPTHDDVTIKGVAEALGSELVYSDEMGTLLNEKLNSNSDNGNSNSNSGNELTSAQLKMATLPSSAKLRYLSTDEWPVLQCSNIFVLPGVPEFFSKKIENVAAYLSSQLERSIVYKIVLSVDEPSIVDVLNKVVENHSRVSIGSYPFVGHPEFKTVVTVEADLVDSSMFSSSTSSSSAAAAVVTTNGRNNEVLYASSSSTSRNSIFLGRDAIILSKEDRDRNARLALDELIGELPEGSILRVENDDLDPLM